MDVLPVIGVIFHDDHTSSLTLWNEFLPILSAYHYVHRADYSLLMSLIVDRDDSAFPYGHGDITISHGESIIPRLRNYTMSSSPQRQK